MTCAAFELFVGFVRRVQLPNIVPSLLDGSEVGSLICVCMRLLLLVAFSTKRSVSLNLTMSPSLGGVGQK